MYADLSYFSKNRGILCLNITGLASWVVSEQWSNKFSRLHKWIVRFFKLMHVVWRQNSRTGAQYIRRKLLAISVLCFFPTNCVEQEQAYLWQQKVLVSQWLLCFTELPLAVALARKDIWAQKATSDWGIGAYCVFRVKKFWWTNSVLIVIETAKCNM